MTLSVSITARRTLAIVTAAFLRSLFPLREPRVDHHRVSRGV